MLGVAWVGSTSAQAGTPGPGETAYTVVRGDTLIAIAIRFHSTVNAIASRNHILNVNLIHVGQKLIIPASGGTPPPTATTSPGQTNTPAPSATPGGTCFYVVRYGDTLGAIAARNNTTTLILAQLNGILNPNLIYVGQRLTLPGCSGGPTPTTPPGATAVPTSTSAPSGTFELGGHVLSFAYPQFMHTAGMSWAKIQIRWSRGQPASVVAGAVNAAHGNNFKVLLGIVGVPSEMGSDLNSYFQEYAAFVGSVASQYHPEAIEVWNEQNLDREWPAGRISPTSYKQLLQLAYNAIKAASPQTMVISGAPSPTGYFGGGCSGAGCDDKPFMQQFANAGGASYADCIGIHYNEGILSPDATSGDPRGNSSHYTRYYSSMVNTYRAIISSKPLCFTELGYLTPEGLGPLPSGFSWAANTTIAQQAQWLARATTLSRQRGYIRLLIVWNVDATVYGADPQAGYAIVRNGQCQACSSLHTAMGLP
ncbi:MAG: LysM peptidoglycan-binding domain-containing protein [Anaerolineae bacterium]